MMILFVILAIVTSFILGLIVLIQNPKGGGLAGNIAGFSNQFMGVKQTNDALEKGTWIFGGVIAVLCLAASFFMTTDATSTGVDPSRFQNMPGPGSEAPSGVPPLQDPGVQPVEPQP